MVDQLAIYKPDHHYLGKIKIPRHKGSGSAEASMTGPGLDSISPAFNSNYLIVLDSASVSLL
jgi:hypothetical protein